MFDDSTSQVRIVAAAKGSFDDAASHWRIAAASGSCLPMGSVSEEESRICALCCGVGRSSNLAALGRGSFVDLSQNHGSEIAWARGEEFVVPPRRPPPGFSDNLPSPAKFYLSASSILQKPGTCPEEWRILASSPEPIRHSSLFVVFRSGDDKQVGFPWLG